MKDTAEHRVDAGVVIRDARPEEYEAIGEITVAAYLADGYLAEDDYYTETLRDARRRAEHADVITAVDAATERVLGAVAFCLPGTAYAELSGDGEAEFRMLAVDPAARGRGIGDSLVQACLYRARQQGCTAVVTVLRSATGSRCRDSGSTVTAARCRAVARCRGVRPGRIRNRPRSSLRCRQWRAGPPYRLANRRTMREEHATGC